MKTLTVSLLVCAMMALTTAAAVPEAEPAERTRPLIQEAVPEAEPAESTGPLIQEEGEEARAEPADSTGPFIQVEEGSSSSVVKSTACPGVWTGYNGRCFHYVGSPRTWANAEKHCQDFGGNLASVHNFLEYHVIQNMILKLTHSYPNTWLGGCDAAQENIWLWSDGSPFRFNYWSPGQPDNYAKTQHCLVMNFGGGKKFDDQSCNDPKPFVCAIRL